MKILFFFGFMVLNLGAMAPRRISWYHYPLKDLVDPVKSQSNAEAREKLAYVEFCKQLYVQAKEKLAVVTQETNGQVGGTADPQVALYNYNKPLMKEMMEYTPSEIGVLLCQIEQARKDYYSKGRNS